MSNDTEFQLSRIQAEGWKAAQDYLLRGRPGDAQIIASLNPHKSDTERARWYVGFNEAVNRPMLREPFADTISRHEFTTPQRIGDDSCLADLIDVLMAAPAGVRRFSVMRAMRKLAEKRNHEIALKFENEVERVFRSYCESENSAPSNGKLFYRPKDKAGDVWAVHAAKAGAWLDRDTARLEASDR